MAAPDPISREFTKEVRLVRRRFLEQIEPLRGELFRYCRSLAGNVFDAEDLVQETLLKAFSRLSEMHFSVENPRAWLFRVASNLFIDQQRKLAPSAMPEHFDTPDTQDAGALAPQVREALAHLASRLPAAERVAVLLKDAFDFSLADIAGLTGASVGAVKAALHRGREKLARPLPAQPATERAAMARPLLDAFCDAFNRRDIERLAGLFREDAVADVVGMVYELGREQIKQGSLQHTLYDEAGDPQADVREYEGEALIVLWYTVDEGGVKQRFVRDVLRLASDGRQLVLLRYFYFCPETLEEVTRTLGLPVKVNGYRYH